MEKEKFDKEYDKNGDGVLSGNEVLSWVVPSNEYDLIHLIIHYKIISDIPYYLQ